MDAPCLRAEEDVTAKCLRDAARGQDAPLELEFRHIVNKCILLLLSIRWMAMRGNVITLPDPATAIKFSGRGTGWKSAALLSVVK